VGLTDELEDDEFVFRRIPASKTDWVIEGEVMPEAYSPRVDDNTGISVTRKKYKSLIEAAKGMSPRGYYIAVLRVGDLRAKGIEVVHQPYLKDDKYDRSHAEISLITYQNRKQPEVIEAIRSLAEELTLGIQGPFHATH